MVCATRHVSNATRRSLLSLTPLPQVSCVLQLSSTTLTALTALITLNGLDDQFDLLLKEKLSELYKDALNTVHPDELKEVMNQNWDEIRNERP